MQSDQRAPERADVPNYARDPVHDDAPPQAASAESKNSAPKPERITGMDMLNLVPRSGMILEDAVLSLILGPLTVDDNDVVCSMLIGIERECVILSEALTGGEFCESTNKYDMALYAIGTRARAACELHRRMVHMLGDWAAEGSQ